MLTIRPAEPSDAGAIARGEWATAETPGLLVGRPGEIPLEVFRAKIIELASSGCYRVAERDGTVVGHAMLDPMRLAANRHVFHLTIVVHPGHTGASIGTALMNDVLGWARGHAPLEKIELLVRATNARAIALYRRFGFVEEGTLRRRVRTADGEFIDDITMAWFKEAPK
jgi:RimJ/RimL family protein N-acetyltransferase